VENDPGKYDPDFWLDYFKRIHADGVLLSAGGIVAFYPTDIPLHHRSSWMGNTDPLGYLVKECRKMNMSIILRTDPHAARQNMYDAYPDYIAVAADIEELVYTEKMFRPRRSDHFKISLVTAGEMHVKFNLIDL
jgi:hypothetical protein